MNKSNIEAFSSDFSNEALSINDIGKIALVDSTNYGTKNPTLRETSDYVLFNDTRNDTEFIFNQARKIVNFDKIVIYDRDDEVVSTLNCKYYYTLSNTELHIIIETNQNIEADYSIIAYEIDWTTHSKNKIFEEHKSSKSYASDLYDTVELFKQNQNRNLTINTESDKFNNFIEPSIKLSNQIYQNGSLNLIYKDSNAKDDSTKKYYLLDRAKRMFSTISYYTSDDIFNESDFKVSINDFNKSLVYANYFFTNISQGIIIPINGVGIVLLKYRYEQKDWVIELIPYLGLKLSELYLKPDYFEYYLDVSKNTIIDYDGIKLPNINKPNSIYKDGYYRSIVSFGSSLSLIIEQEADKVTDNYLDNYYFTQSIEKLINYESMSIDDMPELTDSSIPYFLDEFDKIPIIKHTADNVKVYNVLPNQITSFTGVNYRLDTTPGMPIDFYSNDIYLNYSLDALDTIIKRCRGDNYNKIISTDIIDSIINKIDDEFSSNNIKATSSNKSTIITDVSRIIDNTPKYNLVRLFKEDEELGIINDDSTHSKLYSVDIEYNYQITEAVIDEKLYNTEIEIKNLEKYISELGTYKNRGTIDRLSLTVQEEENALIYTFDEYNYCRETNATIEERTSILNSYTKDGETYKAINNYFHEPINSNLYSTYITEKIRKDIKIYVDKVYENFLKILKMNLVEKNTIIEKINNYRKYLDEKVFVEKNHRIDNVYDISFIDITKTLSIENQNNYKKLLDKYKQSYGEDLKDAHGDDNYIVEIKNEDDYIISIASNDDVTYCSPEVSNYETFYSLYINNDSFSKQLSNNSSGFNVWDINLNKPNAKDDFLNSFTKFLPEPSILRQIIANDTSLNKKTLSSGLYICDNITTLNQIVLNNGEDQICNDVYSLDDIRKFLNVETSDNDEDTRYSYTNITGNEWKWIFNKKELDEVTKSEKDEIYDESNSIEEYTAIISDLIPNDDGELTYSINQFIHYLGLPSQFSFTKGELKTGSYYNLSVAKNNISISKLYMDTLDTQASYIKGCISMINDILWDYRDTNIQLKTSDEGIIVVDTNSFNDINIIIVYKIYISNKEGYKSSIFKYPIPKQFTDLAIESSNGMLYIYYKYNGEQKQKVINLDTNEEITLRDGFYIDKFNAGKIYLEDMKINEESKYTI